MTRKTGLAFLLYLVSVLACLPVLFAAPANTSKKKPVPAPTILGPQPPHFVAYTDESAFGIPQASDIEGFNTLILSFLLASGPADQADAWTSLSDSQRASLKADYKANNITLLVSAFGSTESPTTHGNDPTDLAQDMAAWVKKWGMDGIDVDYEDFEAVGKGQAVPWLETFTTVLRDNLPAGEFVITHAPVAPWFGRGQPYAQLNETVGHLIDWYNVQFYSQGLAYTTCETLVNESGGDFPGTSIMEMINAGIPQEKLVVGKPGTPALVGTPIPSDGNGGGGGTQVASGGGTQQAGGGTQEANDGTQEANGGTQEASGGTQEASGGSQEAGGFDPSVDAVQSGGGTQQASSGTQMASGGTQMASSGSRPKGTKMAAALKRAINPHQNGFLETNTLAQCLLQAKNQGWNAGVMVWEYPDANTEWIKDVRELTWPVDGQKKD